MKALKIALLFISLILVMPGLAQARYDYLIRIKFSLTQLVLYNHQGIELAHFSIALPKITPELPIMGEVKSINYPALWYPTKKIRQAYFKKY